MAGVAPCSARATASASMPPPRTGSVRGGPPRRPGRVRGTTGEVEPPLVGDALPDEQNPTAGVFVRQPGGRVTQQPDRPVGARGVGDRPHGQHGPVRGPRGGRVRRPREGPELPGKPEGASGVELPRTLPAPPRARPRTPPGRRRPGAGTRGTAGWCARRRTAARCRCTSHGRAGPRRRAPRRRSARPDSTSCGGVRRRRASRHQLPCPPAHRARGSEPLAVMGGVRLTRAPRRTAHVARRHVPRRHTGQRGTVAVADALLPTAEVPSGTCTTTRPPACAAGSVSIR